MSGKINRLHKHIKMKDRTYEIMDKKQFSRRHLSEHSPLMKCEDISESLLKKKKTPNKQDTSLETSVPP